MFVIASRLFVFLWESNVFLFTSFNMHFLQDCWFAFVVIKNFIFTTSPVKAGDVLVIDLVLSLQLLLVMDFFTCLVSFLILYEIMYSIYHANVPPVRHTKKNILKYKQSASICNIGLSCMLDAASCFQLWISSFVTHTNQNIWAWNLK